MQDRPSFSLCSRHRRRKPRDGCGNALYDPDACRRIATCDGAAVLFRERCRMPAQCALLGNWTDGRGISTKRCSSSRVLRTADKALDHRPLGRARARVPMNGNSSTRLPRLSSIMRDSILKTSLKCALADSLPRALDDRRLQRIEIVQVDAFIVSIEPVVLPDMEEVSSHALLLTQKFDPAVPTPVRRLGHE